MAISAAGIGSNLDINGIISKLMQVEAQPLAALDKREAAYQAKLTAYGSLKAAMTSFQSSIQALKNASTFTALKPSSSDTTILGASLSGSPVAGNYAVNVTALAKAQIQVAGTGYAETDAALGLTGTLAFTVGGNSFSVTLEATDTLESLVDDINQAANNSGVAASVVNDGSALGNRLVITATKTGVANAVTIDESGLVPASPFGFAVTQPAQDLALTVNGIAVTKSSNSVSDAIQGVTLSVLKEGAATVTVVKDASSAKSAIDAFVKAYNDLNKTLKQLSAYNSETKQAAILQGEASVRTIQSQVRSVLASSVAGTDTYHTLSQLGISFQKDGSLSVDSTKLGNALSANAADVANLFAGDGIGSNPLGLATQLNTLATSLLGPKGILSGATDGIDRTIKDIDSRREALTRRLTDIEARYRKQFTALDTLISNMTQTSTYLQQQLANLPTIGKK